MITLNSLHYRLNDEFELEQLLTDSNKVHFQEAGEDSHYRTYYDSFDWRLYRQKQLLYVEQHDQQRYLYHKALKQGLSDKQQHIESIPQFIEDFPENWQADLRDTLSIRCVLLQISLQIQTQYYHGLNKNQKTLIRIAIHNPVLLDECGNPAAFLPTTLTINPVRGYAKTWAWLQQRAEKMSLDVPKKNALFTMALNQHKQQHRLYSSKFNLTLNADTATADALQGILKHLFNILQVNHQGVCKNTDSEFLHDFRVAGRRSRVVLAQIKSHLKSKQYKGFQQAFAWLSRLTSEQRDLDVYILKLKQYQASLSPELRANLQPFQDFLAQQQGNAQQTLCQALENKLYLQFCHDWQTLLQTLPTQMTSPAPQSISTFSKRSICKAFEQLYRMGVKINSNSPPEQLHKLRKLGKKLRYLLIFFSSLYPAEQIKRLLKNLKVLQKNLGDFQDCEIQANQTRDFSQQMPTTQVDCLMTMGALSAHLQQQQQQARQEFEVCFQQFSDNKAIYQHLFHAKVMPVVTEPIAETTPSRQKGKWL